MSISARYSGSQPRQTPGGHQLCFTEWYMHCQPGRRLKIYHQSPIGTGRSLQLKLHLTSSLQVGMVYIRLWWSMTFTSQSQWTELSTAFHPCPKYQSERRISAKYSSNSVMTIRPWPCPMSSLRGNRGDRSISWSWMTSYYVITLWSSGTATCHLCDAITALK